MDISQSPVSLGLSPVFNFGRYFGLLPLQLTRDPEPQLLSLKKNYWQILYSAYVLFSNLTIFGFAIVLFYRDVVSSESQIVEQFLDMVYHCHIVLTILICLYQSRNIPRILAIWNRLEIVYQAYENEKHRERILFHKVLLSASTLEVGYFSEIMLPNHNDTSKSLKHKEFIKKSQIVTYSYFVCIFIGALSYFCTIAFKENVINLNNYFSEVAKIYVIEEACTWWTGIYVIVIGHTLEFVWAYGDMLILSISLMLWYQFKRFNKIVKTSCKKQLDPGGVEALRVVHWELAKATKETNKMLNSLTTTVYICNILYLFSRVFNGIEEDLKHPNWFINFEALYAFSYLIFRIFLTTIIATKFASETTKSFQTLNNSPSYCSSETEYHITDRFCTQVLTSNLAITGSGYFYLNRGFIATLVSALITYEVVILQFSAAKHTGGSGTVHANGTQWSS